MSNATAFIASITAFIVAVTGLVAALLKVRGVKDGKPATRASRRTTESLVSCGIAAGGLIGLVQMVNTGWANQNITLATLLFAAIGVLVLFGGTVGVERAWTAWEGERLLAINAAVGPIVGVVVWLTALITMSPLWQGHIS
ncbi:MAG TPA: hypothetical protein VGN81_06675 [Pseudonocardiaceae bacterium]